MINIQMEYVELIKLYRSRRNELSYVEKKDILEKLVSLKNDIGRPNSFFWERLLYETYYKLDLYEENLNLLPTVYSLSKHPKDRFAFLQILLYSNKLDIQDMKLELMDFIVDRRHDLFNRVRAAILFYRSDAFVPLEKKELHRLNEFYDQEVLQNRQHLPLKLYCEISVRYAIRIFKYQPEKEKWATTLLELIEGLLENSGKDALLIMLYEAFSHHNNLRVSSKFISRLIDIYRRNQDKVGYQIALVNGCINAIQQGNINNYYKLINLIGEETITRQDYVETLLGIQLQFSLEWENWDLFSEIYEKLSALHVTHSIKQDIQLSRVYAQFLGGESFQEVEALEQSKANYSFILGLNNINQGQLEEACIHFRECIEASRYTMITGWGYREFIPILMKKDINESKLLLKEYENFINQYGFDVFWPDYYRLLAALHTKLGDKLEAVLYIKRSINSYEVIGKEKRKTAMVNALNKLLLPEYLPSFGKGKLDEISKKLLADRQSYLDLSLDYLQIAKFVEYVSEGQEITDTTERLSKIIFDYFPVNQLTATYKISKSSGKLNYFSSGWNDLEDHPVTLNQQRCYFFTLYEQNTNVLELELITTSSLNAHQQKQIHQLFSYIRPHVANNMYLMEMIRDDLTGFLLRRYFTSQLHSEYTLSKEYNLDLSVIMIDIDNFRKVNEWGHQEGDLVLSEVAEIITSCLGKNDIPCRYGGEEFLIILPKTEGKHAEAKAERIRQRIERGFQNRPYKVTASLGVASLLLCKPENSEELIFMADKAEIQAKTTGKNKVITAWNIKEHFFSNSKNLIDQT